MAALLEVHQLVKRFGGVTALSDVTFAVEPGEIRALIGPNGSGKSTCINILSGIYSPSAGAVRFAGHAVGGRPSHRITRLGMARTFQNIRLFKNMSVLENVMVAAEVRSRDSLLSILTRSSGAKRAEQEARADAERALTIVGMQGLDNLEAGSLPYGKQRLVEIARALAGRPSLMLLDEPAAGMNPEETLNLMETIKSVRAVGVTILVVEHKMDMIKQISDRVTVLDFGRMIAEGTPDDVLGDPKVIEAYLGSGRNRRREPSA